MISRSIVIFSSPSPLWSLAFVLKHLGLLFFQYYLGSLYWLLFPSLDLKSFIFIHFFFFLLNLLFSDFCFYSYIWETSAHAAVNLITLLQSDRRQTLVAKKKRRKMKNKKKQGKILNGGLSLNLVRIYVALKVKVIAQSDFLLQSFLVWLSGVIGIFQVLWSQAFVLGHIGLLFVPIQYR